jgi:hypothetical protein
MAELKISMLEAETAAQLAALIINFTHEEMMQVYCQLLPNQQARIEAIWQTAFVR